MKTKKLQLIYCDCGLLLKEIGCECKWWHKLLIPISEFLPFTELRFGRYKKPMEANENV